MKWSGRNILLGFLLFVLTASGQNMSVVNSTDSPFARLKSIGLNDVRWTDGFWKNRVKLVHNVTIPSLYDVMNQEDVGKSIHNMKAAAGLIQGEYRGNNWQDAWLYKWIEMAVVSFAVTGKTELDKQIDELIVLIARAQEADGYIATQNTVRNRPRFQDPVHHEWYTMGHLLTAAALHHRLTGKDIFLDIAVKVGNFGVDMFRNHNEEMAHFPINPSLIMGAVELYRETRDTRYLELANFVIDIRGKYPQGTDNWQDRIPLREEQEVLGHAVWYTYLYCGAADVYMENGDKTLLESLERLWHDLVENKMYIHGGVCPIYRGFAFRNGDVWRADEVWESAGLPYQLPNAYGYNETCGQVGTFMWNYRMLLATGEARYAEIMEKEIFNGFLGSMGLSGKDFFYVNPTRWHAHEQTLMSNSSLRRGVPGTPNIGTCCPTNYARSLVELQGMFYSTTQDTLWIHHYGANQFDNGNIVLEQKTRFPWDGEIRIQIGKMPNKQVLQIRIPEWAEGAVVGLNDDEPQPLGTGVYTPLSRNWNKGDEIYLNFPMPVRLMRGNPKIEETNNQVAVLRGPLVYTLEEIDLPPEVGIEDVLLPSDVAFTPVYEPDLLGGVTVLNGIAEAFNPQDWVRSLYQPVTQSDFKLIPIKLIPYYTWANRGVSKMSVWLPVDWK